MLCCLWISVWYLCGLWPGQTRSGLGTVPFLMIFAGGYFYVGFGSLAALYQMHRQAIAERAAVAEPTEIIST